MSSLYLYSLNNKNLSKNKKSIMVIVGYGKHF